MQSSGRTLGSAASLSGWLTTHQNLYHIANPVIFSGFILLLNQFGFRNQRRVKGIFPRPPLCAPWRTARSSGLTQQADSPQYVTAQRPNFCVEKKP